MTIIVSSQGISGFAIYNQIIADIYALTARPDLITETALAVRKATMKFHSADFWVPDLTEVQVAVPALPVNNVSFRYSLDLGDSVQFPLFRKVSHIKEYNSPLSGQEIQFKELDADRLLDNYALEDINYFYQAGQTANIRSNKALTYLNVGYWKYPNVISGSYSSWIAQQFPDAIIEEACAQIFRAIGKDSEARNFASSFEENLHLLQMTQIHS